MVTNAEESFGGERDGGNTAAQDQIKTFHVDEVSFLLEHSQLIVRTNSTPTITLFALLFQLHCSAQFLRMLPTKIRRRG